MGSIRSRQDNGQLMFDFRYRGIRCREQSTLPDTIENRRKMEKVLKVIEAEITLGSFDYAKYFPNSTMVEKFAAVPQEEEIVRLEAQTPLFKKFIWEWFEENEVAWKRSYKKTLKFTFKRYLIPTFGETEVSRITKGDILKFRSSLAKVPNGKKTGLSPDRINHIMTPLRMILAEAADRYNFTTPCIGIKQLKVPKVDVEPFSLEEVNLFISKVRPDFRNYYIVRFFTGMRTAEIDGLKWEYVNFQRKEIYVRDTIVDGQEETPKTSCSLRAINMSQPVLEALESQFTVTGKLSAYVFCTGTGAPLNYHNINNRIWYPMLQLLKLKRRRPYQTRHTMATLWLAAGENPEWIARQMGHTNTQMLFTTYSRFVPNLTRQDGSAVERLLIAKKGQEVQHANL